MRVSRTRTRHGGRLREQTRRRVVLGSGSWFGEFGSGVGSGGHRLRAAAAGHVGSHHGRVRGDARSSRTTSIPPGVRDCVVVVPRGTLSSCTVGARLSREPIPILGTRSASRTESVVHRSADHARADARIAYGEDNTNGQDSAKRRRATTATRTCLPDSIEYMHYGILPGHRSPEISVASSAPVPCGGEQHHPRPRARNRTWHCRITSTAGPPTPCRTRG